MLDEPTNGLDPEGVRWLRHFVRGYAATGRTVLVSSHLLAEVAQTVDEVVVFVAGRLVAHAPLAELAGFGPVVRVRTPQAAALRAALDAHGIHSELAGPDLVVAHGVSTETVGRAIAAAGLVVYEIAQRAHRLGTGLPRPHHHRDRSPAMNHLVRSELRKQRSVRFPAIGLAAAAAAGALTADRASSPPPATTATRRSHRGSLTELAHAPYAIVAGAALLAGILGVAGEFRHQTITGTLLAAPRRGRLLTAKVVVHAGLGAMLAVVAAAVNLAVAMPWLAAQRRAAVRGPSMSPRCRSVASPPARSSVPPAPVSAP